MREVFLVIVVTLAGFATCHTLAVLQVDKRCADLCDELDGLLPLDKWNINEQSLADLQDYSPD